MPVSRRRSPVLLCCLCLVFFSGLLPAARAQQPPVDAAEISRDLLYHPARRIEFSDHGPVFRAERFTDRFDSRAGWWEVALEKNDLAEASQAVKSYQSVRLGVALRFQGIATQSEGILEVNRGESAEPVARLSLWNRQQLAATWIGLLRHDTPSLTAQDLAKELEIAEPEVAAVADDGTYLWFAIRHYDGEGWLGIGTLLRFDPQTNQTKVYQPQELATSSITQVAAAAGALWLGTHRQGEGTVFATAGMVRFDPATAALESYLPETSPLPGRIVTALAAQANHLWVATDAGFCRIQFSDASAGTAPPPPQKNAWACWRIVPTVHLAAPTPASSRPGGAVRGRLPAGDYEVLWANSAFFEVVTPDALEGWLDADDFKDYAKQRFFADPFELGNPSAGGAAVMRLMDKPEGDPLAAAQAFRAPLERLGAPTAQGWQRVRARIGWISRKSLEVTPEIVPIGPEARR